MAGVLLHEPMVRSREHARDGAQREWIDGVAAVFGVVAEPAADDAGPVSDVASTDVVGSGARTRLA